MAVTVAGLWELGWLAPHTEYDLWRFPTRDMAVDGWYMAPVTGLDRPDVLEVTDLDAAVGACPDATVVVLDERAATSLDGFDHPDDALYVFGKANRNPAVTGPHKRIRIDTEAGSRGLLWPHQALAVVLYDRLVKSWQ